MNAPPEAVERIVAWPAALRSCVISPADVRSRDPNWSVAVMCNMVLPQKASLRNLVIGNSWHDPSNVADLAPFEKLETLCIPPWTWSYSAAAMAKGILTPQLRSLRWDYRKAQTTALKWGDARTQLRWMRSFVDECAARTAPPPKISVYFHHYGTIEYVATTQLLTEAFIKNARKKGVELAYEPDSPIGISVNMPCVERLRHHGHNCICDQGMWTSTDGPAEAADDEEIDWTALVLNGINPTPTPT